LNDNQIVNDGRFPIVVEPSDKNHAITNADNTSIVFKVQLGTFKNKIPVDIINKLIDALAGAGFEHIVNKENGYTDYMSGNFNNYNSAEEYKDKLVEKGIKDAFVVAFQNNHKITVPKALELLKNK
jgi:cell division septation protein DedD